MTTRLRLPMLPPSPWRAVLVTLLAGGFVAYLTLRPAYLDTLATESNFWCLLGCGDETVRDLLSNILLFVPLGWALRHWTSHGRAVGVCLLTTIAIEVLQATVISGRDSSLRDVLCNTAGGALGSWLFVTWRGFVWPTRGNARRLGLAATLGWLAVLGVTAAGNRLSPTTDLWFGFWTPDLAYYRPYTGGLSDVRLDDWIPENGPISDPTPLRRAMERDSFRLSLDLVSGATRGRSLIFAVIDEGRRSQVLLGQQRRSLWVQWRNRFEAWDLRGTMIRIPIMPGHEPGSRVHVETGRDQRAIYIRATSGDSTIETRVPETVGLGWNALMPYRLPISSNWIVFNPIWLAGLAFPLAYWFARGEGLVGLALSGTALLLGLLLLPTLAGAAATTRPEWMGGSAGALLGIAAGRGSRRRVPLDRDRP